MFEAAEIRKLLGEAKQPLKAMILLAVNGGLGQSDLALLPTRALDLDTAWLDFARVKTIADCWGANVRRKHPQCFASEMRTNDTDSCFRWSLICGNGAE